MAQPDSSSSSSDTPPKRLFRKIGKWAAIIKRKQVLYILLPLILVNAGVLRMVVKQVTIKAHASTVSQVKDETTTLPAEGQVAPDTVTEDTLSPTDQPVITTYTVKSGDTLSGIADKFNISINTIRWANDITSKSAIKPGEELVILPVSGVQYTVKKGDTLSGIAVKFGVDQSDILNYNDIEADSIKVGIELVIPNAEPLPVAQKAPAKKAVPLQQKAAPSAGEKTQPASPAETSHTAQTSAKFSMPVSGAILTQGIHDGNAVDLGVPIGTEVKAAAAGTVLIAKDSGSNGGYGKYVVINHADGAQTLYAHLSKVSVSVGEKVSQGEEIALSGNTGHSTGPHLHYKEMGTGARNTFAKYKTGTQF